MNVTAPPSHSSQSQPVQYELASAFSRRGRYRLVWLGLLVGVFSGLVAVAYRLALQGAEQVRPLLTALVRGPLSGLLYFAALTLAALAVGRLCRGEPLIKGSGIPQVEGQLLGFFQPQWLRVLVKKFGGGFLCILAGLSLGREGPSIQLGAMAAQGLTEKLRLSRLDRKYLLTCGAAAGLSAAFNAPLAGLMFSLEEIQKNFSSRAIFPVLIASVAADVTSKLFFGLGGSLGLSLTTQALPLGSYWLYPLLGLVMGGLGAAYNKSLFALQRLYSRLPAAPQYYPLLPFLLAGVLALTWPQLLGGGHEIVARTAAGDYGIKMLALLLLAKLAFSQISFCCGAPGGIFFPLLVLGGLTGALFGQLAVLYLGLPPQFAARFMLLGMGGMFAAVVRAPLTGVILVLEMSASLTQVLGLSLVSGVAWLTADLLHARPVYEQMLDNLAPQKVRGKRHGTEQNIIEIALPYKSGLVGKTVSQVDWPQEALVVCIIRGDSRITPKGDTLMESGDVLAVVCYVGDEGPVRAAIDAYAVPGIKID